MGLGCSMRQVPVYNLDMVSFEGPVTPAELNKLFLNDKLTNFRTPEKQKEALTAIANLPEGMIYIARSGNEIIGYITFNYPEEYSRWSRHPRILELGGIEISPDWRSCGIGKTLLKEAFANPVMDGYIVVAIEFCWHWDLKGSNLSIYEYQRMLTKLFGSVGLLKRKTDDPDIKEHPANVLMARAGKNVSLEELNLFENMLIEGRNPVLQK